MAATTAAAEATNLLAPSIHANYNFMVLGTFLTFIVCSYTLLGTYTIFSTPSTVSLSPSALSINALPHTSNLYFASILASWNDTPSLRVSSSSTPADQAVPQQRPSLHPALTLTSSNSSVLAYLTTDGHGHPFLPGVGLAAA